MKSQVQLDCKSDEGNPIKRQVSSTTLDQEQVKLFSQPQLQSFCQSRQASASTTQDTQTNNRTFNKILYILLTAVVLLFIAAFLIQSLQMGEMEKVLLQLEHKDIQQPSYHSNTKSFENSSIPLFKTKQEQSSHKSQILISSQAQLRQSSALENLNQKPKDLEFNLWDLTTTEKEDHLRIYSMFMKTQHENTTTINILNEVNQQTIPFFSNFAEHSNELKWWSIDLNETQLRSYKAYYNKILHYKTIEQNQFLIKYKTYKDSKEFVYDDPYISVTKAQVFDAIQTYRLTGQDKNANIFKEIIQKQKLRLEEKYKISEYKNQLRACVIVPTFNNAKNNRLIWNIESILQQEYLNYKVIIIDDGSSDKTVEQIARHLRWRNASADKFVLIKSNTRNKSLYNIYYAVHKFCALGQIVYTIDGDDQLIGTQVFKLINVIYQKQKVYTLYTTYLNKSHKSLRLGYNQNYSFNTIQSNLFRKDDSHSYSHLRTMMSDLFLLINDTSLKNEDGKFYQMITDNAVYFCALELSCKRVRHLQEINYLYNFDTGINLAKTADKNLYKRTMERINNAKPYRCIDEYLLEAKRWYNTSFG